MVKIKKNKEISVHSITANNYEIREETLDGRAQIVVPAVMMKEGVHNGSHGAIYHVPEELERFTASWDGIPVMIQHPEQDGVNVSANSPRVLETAVGRIFNTTYDDGLKAEVWIDVEKITSLDPQALAYIRQGRPLDVSVGVFTDEEPTQGEWNGESYGSIARNYRPDHLALLPGATGACSWADGCGIRNNQEGGEMNGLLKSFKDLASKGYAVSLINNEEGFREISNLLRSKLDAMDTNSRTYYLEEVFADEFIYQIRNGEGGSTLYKRGYSVENGEVTMDENLTEVRKSTSYVTMAMKRTKNNIETNEKEDNMSETKKPCCEAKVDALIANKQTDWAAADREVLMTLEESVINKMIPKEIAPVVHSAQEIVEIGEEALTIFKDALKTVEDYAALMPEKMKAQFEAGMVLYTETRKATVQGIMDNTEKGAWKQETLEAMDDDTLASIAKTAKVVDYSGQASGGTIKEKGVMANEDILFPADVVFETEKK